MICRAQASSSTVERIASYALKDRIQGGQEETRIPKMSNSTKLRDLSGIQNNVNF